MDLGGEVKMDSSQEFIIIGSKKVTMLPETKSKYTLFPSNDPKYQIQYQENDFANYLIMPKIEVASTTQMNDDIPWVLGFDGSYCSTSSIDFPF